ncbi:ChaN family lipoprotein [Comamonas resistens]|uniref:ChaN family lipoprotein n=1 Tax=Comamonas resistens TaxID=3046670 RepID=A0ABY8SPN9_9BURK|nr:ChaN family lipoprotein [Comamonas resistens]MDL5035629.1 ChaN family lipoprotein [Comamonas resistens]WHS65047.1 ChaN family lipoprotein [Comamonas resistens]
MCILVCASPTHSSRPALSFLATAAALLLGGCAHQASTLTSSADWQQTLAQWTDAQVIALGEQHDQIAHHQWEAQTVQWLAAGQRLGALVIEMAPAGGSTAGLATTSTEEQVQQALQWQSGAAGGGWPWQDYGPMVMNAVRAGVPVLGGNLPRAQMKQTMGQSRYDSHLPASGWQLQLDAIKDGHCGLLPESQFAPMARIQLARDESMAKVAATAVQQWSRPGQSVLLVAGRSHVRSDIGVPTWLPKDLRQKVAIAQSDKAPKAINMKADKLLTLAGNASQDQCAQLREQWKSRPAPQTPAN